MVRYAIAALLVIGGIAIALFILQVVFQISADILQTLGRAVAYPFHAIPKWRRKRAALAAQRAAQRLIEAKQRTRQAELEEIQSYRRSHPVHIVGKPDAAALHKTTNAVDQFISAANAFRPVFDPTLVDTRFRDVRYMPVAFARFCDEGIDATVSWQMTPGDLTIAQGASIKRAYGATDATEFPVQRAQVAFDASGAPSRPFDRIPSTHFSS
jgi:hypothetical protein